MRTRTISRITARFGLALLAVLTVFATIDAHAQAITVTGTDVTATAGSTADVAFNFNFGSSGTSITSFAYELTFDPTVLALTGVSVDGVFSSLASIESGTGQFTPFATDQSLSTAGLYFPPPTSINTAGDGVATWYDGTVDPNSGQIVPLTVSGESTVSYVFDVLSSAVAGTLSSVSATIDSFTDADFNPEGPVGGSATVTVTAPIAVPEISDGPGAALALTWLAGFIAVLRGRKKTKP